MHVDETKIWWLDLLKINACRMDLISILVHQPRLLSGCFFIDEFFIILKWGRNFKKQKEEHFHHPNSALEDKLFWK